MRAILVAPRPPEPCPPRPSCAHARPLGCVWVDGWMRMLIRKAPRCTSPRPALLPAEKSVQCRALPVPSIERCFSSRSQHPGAGREGRTVASHPRRSTTARRSRPSWLHGIVGKVPRNSVAPAISTFLFPELSPCPSFTTSIHSEKRRLSTTTAPLPCCRGRLSFTRAPSSETHVAWIEPSGKGASECAERQCWGPRFHRHNKGTANFYLFILTGHTLLLWKPQHYLGDTPP